MKKNKINDYNSNYEKTFKFTGNRVSVFFSFWRVVTCKIEKLYNWPLVATQLHGQKYRNTKWKRQKIDSMKTKLFEPTKEREIALYP